MYAQGPGPDRGPLSRLEQLPAGEAAGKGVTDLPHLEENDERPYPEQHPGGRAA